MPKKCSVQPRFFVCFIRQPEALRRQGNHSSADMVMREFERSWTNADTKLVAADIFDEQQKVARANQQMFAGLYL